MVQAFSLTDGVSVSRREHTMLMEQIKHPFYLQSHSLGFLPCLSGGVSFPFGRSLCSFFAESIIADTRQRELVFVHV